MAGVSGEKYEESHREEHPDIDRRNIAELEERPWEKAGNEAGAIWPGEGWKPDGREEPVNFQDAAREWWREHRDGLDAIGAETRMANHDGVLRQRLETAREQGRRLVEVLGEMARDRRGMDWEIGAREAGAMAEHAGTGALEAQEKIGHPLRDDRTHFGAWTAQERLEDLSRHLSELGRKRLDGEYVSGIFEDLEQVAIYGERVDSLEHDTGGEAGDVLDRATQELVQWAIDHGEFGRWAEGRRLGFELNDTAEQIWRMSVEREKKLSELWGRAEHPGRELSERETDWLMRSGYSESWIRDYQEVLEALDGNPADDLPGWARTSRGTVLRRGADQLREQLEDRIRRLEELTGGT